MSTDVKFESLLNFRDVATVINDAKSKTHLKHGQLYRSARPDFITSADKALLQHIYKVKTIIDLRSKTEHIEAAKKRTELARLASSEASPVSNNLVAEPLKIPRINYAEINLNGKGFERHLLWQLSYRNIAWLAGYMLFGYRLEGISIISKNVLQPRGLIGLGKDTLRHSGPEIKEVFDVLANPASYPVLVHCTQGKDRTGLTVALVLLLCNIDVPTITADYVLSEKELEPEFEQRMKEIRSIGLDETFALCPSSFVPEITQCIQEEFGGIESYLQSIGIKSEAIGKIRAQLLP